MREADRLVKIILDKCQGCLLYSVCSVSCTELYEELINNNVNIPLGLINPVGLAQRVEEVVERWGRKVL